MRALRATTGPDAFIMDQYGMNGQAGTMEISGNVKTVSGRQTGLRPRATEKEKPCGAGLFQAILARHDLGGLHALRTLGGFELHLLAFLQTLESVSLDGREVHEHIGAAIRRSDETETLGIVKPLYSTTLHSNLSSWSNRRDESRINEFAEGKTEENESPRDWPHGNNRYSSCRHFNTSPPCLANRGSYYVKPFSVASTRRPAEKCGKSLFLQPLFATGRHLFQAHADGLARRHSLVTGIGMKDLPMAQQMVFGIHAPFASLR